MPTDAQTLATIHRGVADKFSELFNTLPSVTEMVINTQLEEDTAGIMGHAMQISNFNLSPVLVEAFQECFQKVAEWHIVQALKFEAQIPTN